MTEQSPNEKVSKDALFNSIVKEAGEFYSLVLTVASVFLGGSLVFLEKIAQQPVKWSFWVLGFGWLSLIISIGLSVHVRLKNLESGRLALEGQYDEARKIDRKNERCTVCMTWTLLFGVLCIAIFGMINLILKGP